MRKLKLLSLLMLICFSVGNLWAALPANPTWKATALGSIPDGATVIVLNNFGTAIPNADATSAGPKKISASFNSTTKEITVSTSEKSLNDIVWTAKKTTNGVQFFVYGSTTKYLGITSAGNSNIRVNTSATYKEMVMGSAGNLMKPYDLERYIGEYVSGTDWRSYNAENASNYKSGTTLQSLTFYVLDEGEEEETACATPSFTPTAGAVASGTQVAISCSTDGAAIHYTTDGTDPTASSTTYSSAITVSSATTIKAIAVKDGLSNSEIATAAYTILTPQSISAIMPASTDEGAEFLLNDVTVTYAYGSNVYVKDASGYMLVYSAISGAANGKVLQGLQGKAKLYNQLPEISTVTKAPTVTDGSAVAPESLTAYPVAADINKYVTMENVTFASAATLSGSVINVTGTFDGSDLIFRNTFKLSGVSLTAGTPYRVVGIVQKYNDNFQIYPISFEEIVGSTQVATPTFSPAAGTYTEVQSVTLSCETDDASIYYTTNGDVPTSSSTLYSGAISVGESMTIKAIAVKGGMDDSNVATAAYTINLPLPSHDFQVTHHFSTEEEFVFPTGWGGSYAEHEIAYTDDKVYFESASKQSGTITDCPVTKNQAIRLILTNSHKLISAVRFDYKQWGTKAQTLTMKYSTDGGENFSDFDPVVSSTDFALQVLTMPEGVNAIQVTGANSSNQVGLTSIAFDLIDKPIVTKTVTITTPTNGTLVVKDAGVAISSGDAIEVGTTLTIEATPASGYLLSAVSVVDEDEAPVSVSESAFVVPSKNVIVSATFIENVKPDATLTLSELGVTHNITGNKQDDVITLPLTASACSSKTFVGWSANASCAEAPEYAPGAEYTLASTTQTLYAVYAIPAAGSTWNVATSIAAGDVVVISTNTGYTAHDLKTAGEISSSIFGATASTYGSENAQITALAEGTMEFTVGGNATDGWTLKNGTKYLKVTGAKKVGLVDDAETWAISFSGNNATLAPKTGDFTAYSIQYNYNSGNDRFTAYNTVQVAISIFKQAVNYSNYSTDCPAQVATPTFSLAAGTYTEVQSVTLSCETDDATIYYTTNGDEPTASSTEYTAAITVDESMTIKAIAVKAGLVNSEVASAAYTITLPVVLTTIQAVYDKAVEVGSTATDVSVTFNNWVVSGVNGDAAYVTDGTKGFVIYASGHGFVVNDKINGTVQCKVQLYRGYAEVTTLTAANPALTVTKDGVVTPVTASIASLGAVNTGAPIILNNVQFNGSVLSDGANSITPYTTFYADAVTSLESGKYYNITGIYVHYNTTKEVAPRSAADIEELSLADPEISYTPASATIELGEELPGTVFANPHELAISYSTSNDAVATVSNAGVISLEGGIGTAVITAHTDGDGITYAAGNATYTITVDPAGSTQNVVILALHGTKYYAMSTTIESETAVAIEVEYDGTKVTVNNSADKGAIQWTKKTIEDNTTFQTKDEDKLYLKGTSGGGTLSLNANACNWAWDGTNNCYVTGTRGFIYRASLNGFKNYAVSNLSNADYVAPQVIVIAPENIVVTAKVSAELAYDPESNEITQGDAWSAPTLVNPYSVTIASYNSDNEAVATVDGGVIALAGGIGTAHITAHFDGDASYLEGEAVYTITVNAPAPVPTGTTYRKVTSTENITDGEYLIVYEATEATGVAFNGALETLDAEGNSVAVTINEGVIAGTTAIDAAVFTIDVTAGTLQSASGYYIGVSSNSNGLKQTENAATYTHTFSIDGEGNAVILANFTSSTMKLRYNPSTNAGNLRFRYYKNDGQETIQLYKKEVLDWEDGRTGLTAGNYYTICLPKKVTHFRGATIWDLKKRNMAGTEVYLEEAQLPFAAGTPFIIHATAETLEVVYEGDATGTPVENGALRGTLSGMTYEQLAGAGTNIYILKDNAIRPIISGNWLSAQRAYIDYDELDPVSSAPQGAPGRRVRAIPMQGQTATGIDALNASETPVKMMIDGQLFILRGEKLYDATGRLVK